MSSLQYNCLKPVDSGPNKNFKLYTMLQVNSSDILHLIKPIFKIIKETYDIIIVKPLNDYVFDYVTTKVF